jgi:hypothetical protein
MTVAEIVQAEKELGTQLEEFAGKWVATCDFEVVAHADTLGELLEQVESQGLQEKATVRQVPQHPGAACFF